MFVPIQQLIKKACTFYGGSSHTDGIFVKFVLFIAKLRRLYVNVYDGVVEHK